MYYFSTLGVIAISSISDMSVYPDQDLYEAIDEDENRPPPLPTHSHPHSFSTQNVDSFMNGMQFQLASTDADLTEETQLDEFESPATGPDTSYPSSGSDTGMLPLSTTARYSNIYSSADHVVDKPESMIVTQEGFTRTQVDTIVEQPRLDVHAATEDQFQSLFEADPVAAVLPSPKNFHKAAAAAAASSVQIATNYLEAHGGVMDDVKMLHLMLDEPLAFSHAIHFSSLSLCGAKSGYKETLTNGFIVIFESKLAIMSQHREVQSKTIINQCCACFSSNETMLSTDMTESTRTFMLPRAQVASIDFSLNMNASVKTNAKKIVLAWNTSPPELSNTSSSIRTLTLGLQDVVPPKQTRDDDIVLTLTLAPFMPTSTVAAAVRVLNTGVIETFAQEEVM